MMTCRNRLIQSDAGDDGVAVGSGAVLSKALVETVDQSCVKRVSIGWPWSVPSRDRRARVLEQALNPLA